ncbi:MAG: hypothetical protein JO165_12080 [Candidatus Eremiobacteraeota bacterium]|nr:hypothetical protein [Candidatus Eremiobacteraeota bacterium]
MSFAKSIVCGLGGAVTLTAAHQVLRKITPQAPHLDALGMQGISRLSGPSGKDASRNNDRYMAAVLLDLFANGMYFSLAGIRGSRASLKTGFMLGAVAGVGSVALPRPLGFDKQTTSRSPLTALLSVALYTIGGFGAGLLYRLMSEENDFMADEQHSLQTYVSDMLAVERHVRIPFDMQAGDHDFSGYGNAWNLVQRLVAASQAHIGALQQCLDDLGGHAAAPVKEAVTQVEGFVAGAIDKMRKTKVSKALRDDYTALALCTAGYTMLQTTATAMKNDSVAQLAQQHLQDYAALIMDIGRSLPEVVIAELEDIGLQVDPSMAQPAQRAAEEAWRTGAQRAAKSESASTAA